MTASILLHGPQAKHYLVFYLSFTYILSGQIFSVFTHDVIFLSLMFGTVDKENKDNWKWLLELLAQDLRITNTHHWAFMTDRQKVIPYHT